MMFRQRRFQRRGQVRQVRLKLPGSSHERQRHEAEQPKAVLDQREAAQPQRQPAEASDRQNPPPHVDTGQEAQRGCRPADFGCEQQQIDQEFGDQWNALKMDAESFTHRGSERSPAHRRQTPGHFDHHGQHQRRRRDRPEKLKAEFRTGLRRGGNRADFDESANAGHDSQNEIDDGAHR